MALEVKARTVRLNPKPNLKPTNHRIRKVVWDGGVLYMMKACRFDKEVSVTDLKGSAKSGKKGLCDLLIFKHSLKQ